MATTIKYGVSNEIRRDFDRDTKVSELLMDRAILGALNAPEGVHARANGETLSGNEYVSDFSTIYLDKAASSKA